MIDVDFNNDFTRKYFGNLPLYIFQNIPKFWHMNTIVHAPTSIVYKPISKNYVSAEVLDYYQ